MQAAAEGEKHQPPLAVKLSDIELGQELADHSYSVVTQGTWESFPVAVKRVKIGTSQDLDSFRREIQIMATLDHPGIVHLYGARVLPPGTGNPLMNVVLQLAVAVVVHASLAVWPPALLVRHLC